MEPAQGLCRATGTLTLTLTLTLTQTQTLTLTHTLTLTLSTLTLTLAGARPAPRLWGHPLDATHGAAAAARRGERGRTLRNAIDRDR